MENAQMNEANKQEEIKRDKPQIYIKDFGNKELRFINHDSETLFVGRDVCDILNVSYYYLSKIPNEYSKLIHITTKTGAFQKTNLINAKGMNYLCDSIGNCKNFKRWLSDEFPNEFIYNTNVQQSIEKDNTLLNYMSESIDNTFTPDKIKLLNSILDIINSDDKSKQELLFRILNAFGLNKKSGQTSEEC